MSRILLLHSHKENCRLLSEWLATHYQVIVPSATSQLESQHLQALAEPFDLCILDKLTLHQFGEQIQAIKQAQQPVFLPFLLVIPRQDVRMVTRQAYKSIDEFVTTPIEKVELGARVEMLLQTRQLSLKLKADNERLRSLNELKSRFVSMASHELRNPLTAILMAATMLETYGETASPEKKSKYFNQISSRVKLMTALLDDVLVISKAEVGKLEFNPASLNLQEFCWDLVEEVQLTATSEHKINFAITGECTEVYMDHRLLRHILNNLLTNAIKYSPAGGTVDFHLTCQDEVAIFQIKDEGLGIPPDKLERLFEAFYRATNVGNIPGTGLGLPIVKQSVDLHGGKMTVASEVGVGTTFTVILPLKSLSSP